MKTGVKRREKSIFNLRNVRLILKEREAEIETKTRP